MSKLTHGEETLSVPKWAERVGISAPAMYARLKRMSLGEALKIPPKSRAQQDPKQPGEATSMADQPEKDEAPVQREVDLPRRASAAAPLQLGERVRVYHKRRTTMFLSDCKLGPHEEREILASDYARPAIAVHLIKVA